MKRTLQRKAQHRRANFTLVEIMVAVGMLMLIMSFLFQFVLGSQQLWNASDHAGRIYDTAQLVMDVLGEDVRNLQYANSPGSSKPFYYAENVGTLTFEVNDLQLPSEKTKMFMFITQTKGIADSNKVGLYPVVYIYVGDTENYENADEKKQALIRSISRTLFRVVLTSNSADNNVYEHGLDKSQRLSIRRFPLLDFVVSGNSPEALKKNEEHCTSFETALRSLKLTEEDILAADISGFDWYIYTYGQNDNVATWQGTGANSSFLASIPASFQVKLRVFCKDAIPYDEWVAVSDRNDLIEKKYERAFTKRFFVANPAGVGGGN